jgi:hypothetical protein
MDNLNIQALLTKGSLLSSVKRKSEAIDHYREVIRLSPFNYDGNKGGCMYVADRVEGLPRGVGVREDIRLSPFNYDGNKGVGLGDISIF